MVEESACGLVWRIERERVREREGERERERVRKLKVIARDTGEGCDEFLC